MTGSASSSRPPIAALMGGLLLILPFAPSAAPLACGEVRIQEIAVPTRRPESCIEVPLKQAVVLLDKALVDAHAKDLLPSHPGDEHLSRLSAKRARELLQAVAPRDALHACARVVEPGPSRDWIYYVSVHLDHGWAAVQPAGSAALAATITVRESSPPCSNRVGGIWTRFYGTPGGPWFLPLLTGIS